MKIRTLLISSVLLFVLGGTGLTIPIATHGAKEDILMGEEYKKIVGQTGQTVSKEHPVNLVRRLIYVLLGFLGLIVVCLLLYAGWLYLSAGGKSEQVETAQKLIVYAVIGAAIIISAWAISAWVINEIVDVVQKPPASSSSEPLDIDISGAGLE